MSNNANLERHTSLAMLARQLSLKKNLAHLRALMAKTTASNAER